MKIDERALEAAARAQCIAEGVDPEHDCIGLGRLLPEGETWPAWKVRIAPLTAAIEAYEAARPDPNPWRPIADVVNLRKDTWIFIWHDIYPVGGRRLADHFHLEDMGDWAIMASSPQWKGAMFREIDPPS